LWAAKFDWNEFAISVHQKLVTSSPSNLLSESDLLLFIARAGEQCAQLAGTVKFGKLLQSFVVQFSPLSDAAVEAMCHVASQLTTMMKKAILKRLKQ
jgi:hypothetical protein